MVETGLRITIVLALWLLMGAAERVMGMPVLTLAFTFYLLTHLSFSYRLVVLVFSTIFLAVLFMLPIWQAWLVITGLYALAQVPGLLFRPPAVSIALAALAGGSYIAYVAGNQFSMWMAAYGVGAAVLVGVVMWRSWRKRVSGSVPTWEKKVWDSNEEWQT
jgi:predicted MFS family arabinose efflux permease